MAISDTDHLSSDPLSSSILFPFYRQQEKMIMIVSRESNMSGLLLFATQRL